MDGLQQRLADQLEVAGRASDPWVAAVERAGTHLPNVIRELLAFDREYRLPRRVREMRSPDGSTVRRRVIEIHWQPENDPSRYADLLIATGPRALIHAGRFVRYVTPARPADIASREPLAGSEDSAAGELLRELAFTAQPTDPADLERSATVLVGGVVRLLASLCIEALPGDALVDPIPMIEGAPDLTRRLRLRQSEMRSDQEKGKVAKAAMDDWNREQREMAGLLLKAARLLSARPLNAEPWRLGSVKALRGGGVWEGYGWPVYKTDLEPGYESYWVILTIDGKVLATSVTWFEGQSEPWGSESYSNGEPDGMPVYATIDHLVRALPPYGHFRPGASDLYRRWREVAMDRLARHLASAGITPADLERT